jgi:serine/threonine-protein kinase
VDLTAPDPLVGRRLAHFTVIERLGGGGMGRVYRARDERLEREVAIKVLPSEMLADPEVRARFQREARALARLTHPSIAAVHAFEREGGLDFLVMERIAGETLEQRLARGPFDEAEALTLGVLLADALEAAHAQGVVHRDIKPGNIMVTPRGEVKVLDFGLAKLLGPAAAGAATEEITRSSRIAGTLSYMAPEQLVAAEIDPRTDVYALGVVLYRMVTGRLPFQDHPAIAIAGLILNTPPPPPRALRPELSPGLDDVVMRCLEKDPARRPASAAALAADLRALRDAVRDASAAGAAPRLSSVAVLPLENLSGDPGQEFFADGMTDTLIATLARIRALRVISRTSVMHYKGARRPLPEIARALRVEAVVEGSVQRSGDRVRITATLVDAAHDSTLWAQSYEREVRDVLALQSEVARAIAEEIRARLTPEERERLAHPAAVDPRVLEHVLHARFFLNRRTAPAIERALELFGAALAIDPRDVAARTGVADAWNLFGVFRLRRPGEAFPRAREAAERALVIDPECAEAHTALGFAALFHDWDWDRAERSYRRALATQPGCVSAHHWYADLLATRGRFDEAIEQAKAARELDPLAPIAGQTHASVLYFARRYDEAIALVQELLAVHPEFPLLRLDLGRLHDALGRPEEALRAFEQAARMNGAEPEETAPVATAYARLGRRAAAEAVIGRMRAAAETSGRFLPPYTIANVYVAMGDPERAFEWLERAFEERDPMMVYLDVHPRLDPLRGDPRFDHLRRRVGLLR